MIGDLLNAWLGADARLWPSLKRLALNPGRLTIEFREGRRTRYLAPLKLFFFCSILLFLLVSFRTDTSGMVITTDTPAVEEGEEGVMVRAVRALVPFQDTRLGQVVLEAFEEPAANLDQLPEEQRNRLIVTRFMNSLPLALLLCLPVVALALRLAYFWRRDLLYFDFLVFALHWQAFLFLGYILIALLDLFPLPSVAYTVLFPMVPLLWQPLYFLRAIKVATGRGYIGGFFTGAWVLTVMGPAFGVIAAGMFLLGILEG